MTFLNETLPKRKFSHTKQGYNRVFNHIGSFIMKKNIALLALLSILPAAATDLTAYPTGTAQDLNTLKAPIRIVNIWATWCGPCRKEIPAMTQWYQKQPKGSVDLIGISLDRNDKLITDFFKKISVGYPIWRYTGKDSRGFMKSLGNMASGVPYTVVEAKGCTFRQSITGEVDGKALDAAIQTVKAKCKK